MPRDGGPDVSPDPEELAQRLREVLEPLPLRVAFLFGSLAGDEASWASDVDVAVGFEAHVPPAERRRILDRLAADVATAAGREEADVVDLEEVGPELAARAVWRGRLLVGSEAEAVDLRTRFLQRRIDLHRSKAPWRQALSERLEEDTYGRS